MSITKCVRALLAAFLLLLVVASGVRGKVIYVDQDAGGANDGTHCRE